MFVAAGELQLEAAHERDVHFRRDQRNRKLGIGGKDGSGPAGVGGRADPEQIAGLLGAGNAVGPGDRTVDARVAVIEIGIAPQFGADCEPDVAGRKRQ